MSNLKIVLLGNKARQGKDTFAKFLQQKLDNVFIIHFADPLKSEVSEIKEMPLIFKKHYNGISYYFLRDKDIQYSMFTETEMPLLHRVFGERNINEYHHMSAKDPLILQVWGTDYRRKQDSHYWVNKTDVAVSNIRLSLNGEKGYVLIPDTRFLNEYDYGKDNNGLYVKAMRMNKDNTQFIDPLRDPTHTSETEIDNVVADFVTMSSSGDLKSLSVDADKFIEDFL